MARQCTVRSAMPPSHSCRYLQGGQANPRPSVNNQVSNPLASGDRSPQSCLCDDPAGSRPTGRGRSLSRCCPAPGRELRAAPAAGEPREGSRGGRDTPPPDRGLQWTPRPAALPGPVLPCPGRRDTSGPSGAGSPLPAARRSPLPRRGARGPGARREKSAATPERPSPRGALGGIGPRFPGLSLRAARGDRGLQRPARPRPQVASFPCRPPEPGGGKREEAPAAGAAGVGGGGQPGGRAPQPLPGRGCRAFPRPRCRSRCQALASLLPDSIPHPTAPSAPGGPQRGP